MNIQIVSIFLFCLLLNLSTGCNQEHSHEGAHDQEQEHDDHHHEEGEIHLTKEQMKTMGIELGMFSELKINDYIRTTGRLGLPPNAVTSVNPKASGFVQNSRKFVEGNYVKKGTVLAYLENPEFINQQQNYLEVTATLKYAKQELERQKSLFETNAGVEKELQRLEAEVASQTALAKGLEKQLLYLGIVPDQLSPESITSRIALLSPASGYITSLNLHNGMHVSQEMEIMQLVNDEHLHLELDVFEKDIAAVKVGQRITYQIPALGDQLFEGEVHVIGKEFNDLNKTVRVHGHLEGEHPNFIKDLFLQARIWLSDQTAQALPEKAVILSGEFAYIYVSTGETPEGEIEFEAIRVKAGETENGYTAVQLIDTLPEKSSIVTQGAYYVYAQSLAEELDHSH